jgi:hypothetical protein
MPASYGGYDLGRSVVVNANPAEPEIQVTAFSGVNGIYTTWHGTRGNPIEVTGLAYGDDQLAVDATIAGLQVMRDGVERSLTDVTGASLDRVILLNVRSEPKYLAGHGGWLKKYTATFLQKQ